MLSVLSCHRQIEIQIQFICHRQKLPQQNETYEIQNSTAQAMKGQIILTTHTILGAHEMHRNYKNQLHCAASEKSMQTIDIQRNA